MAIAVPSCPRRRTRRHTPACTNHRQPPQRLVPPNKRQGGRAVVVGRGRIGRPVSRVACAAGEAIPYFIADGAGVPGYQSSDGELARAAFEAWARESAGRLRFVEAGEADAIIHLIWIAPGSGVYGEMRRVIIDDRPRAFVYVTPGINGQGPAIARLAARDPLLRDTIVYLTCVHELGHAVGLPHTAESGDLVEGCADRVPLHRGQEAPRVHATELCLCGRGCPSNLYRES